MKKLFQYRVIAAVLITTLLFLLIPVSAFADGSKTTYMITPMENPNGLVEILVDGKAVTGSALQFEAGEEITVRATANTGYDLRSVGYWTVQDSKEGSIVTAKQNSNDTYYFEMPASDIKVGASFQKSDQLQISMSGSYIYEPGTTSNALYHGILGKFAHLYVSDKTAYVQIALDKKFFDEYKDENLTFSIQVRTHKNNKYYTVAQTDFTKDTLLSKYSYEIREDYSGDVYYFFDNISLTMKTDADKGLNAKAGMASDREAYCVLQIINNDQNWVNVKGSEIKGYADTSSVPIYEEEVATLEPMVILYGLEANTYYGRKLRNLLEEYDLTFVDITKENMGQSLGYIAGWSKYKDAAVSEEEAYIDAEFSKRYIIMANVSTALGNEIIEAATKLNINPTKSYFKDFAASKNFYQYATHMGEEASATSAAMQWGLLIKNVANLLASDNFDVTTETGKMLRTAYDMALIKYTDPGEKEPEYYEEGYQELLEAYLKATGKIFLAGELELQVTNNGDDTYTITPIHQKRKGDENKTFEAQYGWFNKKKGYVFDDARSIIVSKDNMDTVNLTMTGVNQTHGMLFARLLMPTTPDFSTRADKNSISVTMKEVQVTMNIPEIEKYVAELYQDGVLIASKETEKAGTVTFTGLTKNKEYKVEVYATNAVGFSDIASVDVKTKSGYSSSSTGSSGSSVNSNSKVDKIVTLLIGSKQYWINGEQKSMDVLPYIDPNNRTMIPVRFAAEALGCKVVYDADKRTVTITKGEDVCVLTIGSNQYEWNGNIYTMDTQATIMENRTMIPVRFVTEALGGSVTYADQEITIAMENE